jgi:exonuclease SbcC
MRFEQLNIEGFGPFPSRQEINFARLNQAGLFVMAGPIGAGKTTLLDAICYGLYGETTGQEQRDGRTGTDLRSAHAKPGQETSVEVVFQLGHRRYRVKRNPEYLRAKLKGDGLTKTAASAELFQWEDSNEPGGEGSWSLLKNRTKEVDAMIEELTGFTADQFRRVVVIPQGRYRDVLIADHKERQELLQRIFRTEVYDRFTQIAKEASRSFGESVQVEQGRRAALLSAHAWTVGKTDQEILDAMKIEIQQSTLALAKLDARLGVLADQKQGVDQQLGAGRSLKQLFNKLRELDREKLELTSKLAQHESIRGEIKTAERAMEPYRRLKDRDAALAKVAIVEKELSTLVSLRASSEQRLSEAMLANQDASIWKKRLDEGRERLGQAKERLKNHQEEWQRLQRARQDVQAVHAALQGAESEGEKMGANVKKLEGLAGEADFRWKEAQIRFEQQTAGRLAQNLIDGEPCSVCGSRHHPRLARVDGDLVTGEQLEALELEKNKQHQRYEKERQSIAEWTVRVEEKRKAYEEAKARLSAMPEVLDPSEMKEAVNRQIIENEAMDTQIKERSQAVEICQKNHDNDKGQVEAKESALATLTESARDAAREWEEVLRASGMGSEAEVRSAYREPRWIEESQAKCRQIEEDTSRNESQRMLVIGQIGDQKEPELEALEMERKRLVEQLEEANRDKSNASGALKNLESLQVSFCSYLADVAEKQKKARIAKELYEMVSGQVTGSDRVSLHSWVLGTVMGDVETNATTLLRQMSGGRYELRRAGQDTGSKGGGQKGLEFSVLDQQTGAERPARTLSGGETFLASLAVSLALAETASAFHGGRPLDTIFIDEGFGTLDMESLEAAIKALQMLHKHGRVIGVISHVEELQRTIPAQIRFHKSGQGSRVELVGC